VDWQGQPVKLTVSVGVAMRLAHEQTPAAALERADRALYAAKREGRNRVVLAARNP
jgi:diguanylate cyclase (GGDEF)-like protein